MSIYINFGRKASIFDETITYWEDLGKHGIWVNSGKIGPGKWQKNLKPGIRGQIGPGKWQKRPGKAWENLGLARSGGVDTLDCFVNIFLKNKT